MFFFSFSNCHFLKESADDFSPLTLSCCHKRTKACVKKSETWFFSTTCQEANALFIVVFHPFLVGLELNLHRRAFTKNVSITLSRDFEIFEGTSHNLELLSFQRMCGLLGFM